MKYKENKNPGIVFEVKLLENSYNDILKFHNIYVENHVTRSLKLLKARGNVNKKGN